MPLPFHVRTTAGHAWRSLAACDDAAPPSAARVTLATEAPPAETWQGFGACFNELGWQALRALPATERATILDALFGPDGLRLDLGRIPMGASDYASEWHSYCETRDDHALDTFSIARAQTELLPFIHEALARRPDLDLFASPWSPPTWLKHPAVYNYGRFRMEDRHLDTYARYFARFLSAYREAGVRVGHVHPQNEPVADQKFPSCVWSGEQLRRFIGAHLGPVLAREAPGVGVWLGTMNTADYPGMFLPVLADPDCRRHLRGVGLQWAGKGVAHRLHQLHPELPLWQTENECGDGQNTWDYAHTIFDLVAHYIGAGCTGYAYWNMVLAPGGDSTWGWKQNALVTADAATGRWYLNPEYHVLRHYSAYIRPGARRLPLSGTWSGAAIAFARPEGGAVLVTHNPTARDLRLDARVGGQETSLHLPPQSFHTVVWEH
jgi:glucosylceramidase